MNEATAERSPSGPLIFLCHSKDDKAPVRELCRRLTEDSFNCWFDEQDILPGADWDYEIRQAMRTCRYVLACLSSGSVTKTGYIQKELRQALDLADEQPEGTTFIIPVKLEQCEVPDRLQRWQFVELFADDGYGRLLSALRGANPGSPALGRFPLEELGPRGMPAPQTTADNARTGVAARQPGHRRAGAEPTETGATRRRATIATLAVTVLIAMAVGIGWAMSDTTPPRSDPSPTSTSSLETAPTAETATPSSPSVALAAFEDDFSSPDLDTAKWKPPSRPDVIVQADGRLDISTRPGTGVDYTKLEPIAAPPEFTDVRFRLTMPTYGQGGQGGASFVINPTSDRPHVLGLGPGADNGVAAVPLPCDRSSCRLAVFEDFTYPAQANLRPIKPGETVDIEILRKDGRLVYFADGVQIGASKGDPGPLSGFWFAASAGAEESWDVLVDDLLVQ